MTVNHAMALRVVWGTRIDDDTPATDARELVEMCGLIEPGGHELLPDLTGTGRLIDEQGRPVATAPIRSASAPAPAPTRQQKRGRGRKPIPIEHGTEHGYRQHKAKKVPIPGDDACGCQAAHNVLLKRPARPAPTEPAPDLPPAPEAATGVGTPTAEQIRAQVDAMAERVHDDGSINATYVAIEQTLRTRHGLPSYIPSLDGPGKFYPAPVQITAEPPFVERVNYSGGGSRDRLPPPDPGRQPAALPSSPTDLDEWLAAAQRSRGAAVRRQAQTAVLALLQLRCALDDLARAEREAR